jgi:hypothetical protein
LLPAHRPDGRTPVSRKRCLRAAFFLRVWSKEYWLVRQKTPTMTVDSPNHDPETRSAMQTQDTLFISMDQLKIGLYVHLDLKWFEHPFAFNNFKIKDEEQISLIRSLGLRKMRYDPARSAQIFLAKNSGK